MDHQPKLSPIEAFIFIFVSVIADLLNWIPIVNWIVGISMSLSLLYLKIKGVLPVANLLAYLAEFIPFVSILPMYTTGAIATVIIDRNPRLREKIAKVASVAKPTIKKT